VLVRNFRDQGYSVVVRKKSHFLGGIGWQSDRGERLFAQGHGLGGTLGFDSLLGRSETGEAINSNAGARRLPRDEKYGESSQASVRIVIGGGIALKDEEYGLGTGQKSRETVLIVTSLCVTSGPNRVLNGKGRGIAFRTGGVRKGRRRLAEA